MEGVGGGEIEKEHQHHQEHLQESVIGQEDPSSSSSGGMEGEALLKKKEEANYEGLKEQYNFNSKAVRRLMKEAEEMHKNDERYMIHATPLGGTNLFEWHFTILGPPDTPYANGVYHGRILFPSDFPMKPPHFIMLTPSGRFETGTKICLTISGYHPEFWMPSWGVRTALTAIRAHMASKPDGSIGSTNCHDDVRRSLAMKSRDYMCPECGRTGDILAKNKQIEANTSTSMASNNLSTSVSVKSAMAPQTPKGQPKQSVPREEETVNESGGQCRKRIGPEKQLDHVTEDRHESLIAEREPRQFPTHGNPRRPIDVLMICLVTALVLLLTMRAWKDLGPFL